MPLYPEPGFGLDPDRPASKPAEEGDSTSLNFGQQLLGRLA